MKEYLKELDKNLIYKKHELKDGIYYIYCETNTKKFKHPTKNIYTKSVKDRYTRIIDDIPFCRKQVKLVLTVKRFAFYDLKEEYREDLDFLSNNYIRNRRTERLEEYILDIANNGSSNATEKTLKRNGVKISDTSINRLIKKKRS